MLLLTVKNKEAAYAKITMAADAQLRKTDIGGF